MTGSLTTASKTVAPSAAVRGAGGFVLCSFPEICLAIPQAEVACIEYGTEFPVPDAVESAIVWFDSPRGRWPVCALDSRLHPCRAVQATGSFLVFLNACPVPVGLRCESARIVRSGSELQVHRLPAVMQSSGGGIVQGVVRIDGHHLAMVAAENRLSAYLAGYVTHEVSHE